MEETRGITVKVAQSLHTKAKQEAEANAQTMSQLIEMVLRFYYDRKDETKMSANKRTLAFQVDEEFYQEVQAYIKARKMKLKDFGITALRRMMEDAASDDADTAPDDLDADPDDDNAAPPSEQE